jgi:precorrin-6A synthase
MRRVLAIGIGAGDPDHLTIEAIKALNEVDVFFVVEKGEQKDDDLVGLRRLICDRHIADPSYRTVAVQDPARDRTTTAYGAAVQSWRDARADLYESLIRDELGPDDCGAFMVWGDPAFYDSTLPILDEIHRRGSVDFEHAVIPGISSIQVLAARHRISLNRVGRAVHITTGRRLAEGVPDGVDDVVVMLDAHCSFARLGAEPFDIYWGAYLGTGDEILVAGDVAAVTDEIVRVRGEARERKGWIMDTYLLRRRDAG